MDTHHDTMASISAKFDKARIDSLRCFIVTISRLDPEMKEFASRFYRYRNDEKRNSAESLAGIVTLLCRRFVECRQYADVMWLNERDTVVLTQDNLEQELDLERSKSEELEEEQEMTKKRKEREESMEVPKEGEGKDDAGVQNSGTMLEPASKSRRHNLSPRKQSQMQSHRKAALRKATVRIPKNATHVFPAVLSSWMRRSKSPSIGLDLLEKRIRCVSCALRMSKWT